MVFSGMHTTFSDLGISKIDRAGQFPLLNPVFDFTYRNPTHALHLYDYHGRIRIGSREYSIHPGDMTCISPGTVYSFATDTPGKHWCIHYFENPVQGAKTYPIPNYLRLGVNSLFYLEQVRLISRLCHHHRQDEQDPAQLEARFRLKALLLSLHNVSRGQPAGRRTRSTFSWDPLIAWMDDHLDQPISLPQLAEIANLAPGTLSKKFKDSYKTTLSQYLLHRRIDKAKSLLATTTLTIYEVGSTVGIPDPQYFNKQFRKVTGLSPSRYQDENQEYLIHVPEETAIQEGRWSEEKTNEHY